MKRLFLLLVIVVLLAGLIGCSGVVPESPDDNIARFVGWWFNVDENTDSITKIYIAEVGNSLAVEVWGKCHPEDCYWGKELVESSDAIDGVLEIVWIFSFAERTQELMLLDDNNLKVTTFTHFTDGSGRLDYTIIDYLQK